MRWNNVMEGDPQATVVVLDNTESVGVSWKGVESVLSRFTLSPWSSPGKPPRPADGLQTP